MLKEIMKDRLLKDDEDYMKLALLHDCGKKKAGLFSRVRLVVIGDSFLEKHPETAWEMLVEINPTVAKLAKSHHTADQDKKMKRFQEIDDRN